jgi:replicative superfamily II helicase
METTARSIIRWADVSIGSSWRHDHSGTRTSPYSSERGRIERQLRDHLSKIEQPKEIRDWFRASILARATHESDQSRARAQDIQRQLDETRRQQARLLNLHLAGMVDETMYGAKNTELRDLVARLTLQLEATDRRKDENADLAIKAFELSQDIPGKCLRLDPPKNAASSILSIRTWC